MTGRAGHKNPRVSDSELAGEPAVGHSSVDSDDFTANVVGGYRRGDRVDIAGSERRLATGELPVFLLAPPFALADQRLTSFASWRGELSGGFPRRVRAARRVRSRISGPADPADR